MNDTAKRPYTLISLSDIEISYDGRTVLSNVNLDINRNDFIAITGPNGGGKTTLLRIILQLLSPARGSVKYHENLNIGYLPQKNMVDSRFPITVGETVKTGLLGSKIKGDEARKAVLSKLEVLELSEFENFSLSQLSGGQMQRTLLARALVSNPDILILDEPLSYLDKHFEQRVYTILETLQGKCTIVLVSHEVSTIAAMATRHIIVNRTLHFCHSGTHFVHYDCDSD